MTGGNVERGHSRHRVNRQRGHEVSRGRGGDFREPERIRARARPIGTRRGTAPLRGAVEP
ncbi:hypothetical protein ACFV2S_21065 [Streptomyces sp. NPDC059695]|uniref:hypothetical protein n=1 Tax=Streptomyces sp. NPDC059695 TaxID=3346910 RepID=UPI003681AF1A